MRVMNTSLAMMTAAYERHKRKKESKRIRKVNEANRGIVRLGCVDGDTLFPTGEDTGSTVISGGDAAQRSSLAAACCIGSIRRGTAVILLHEGSAPLVSALTRGCPAGGYLRAVSASSPYYDPIYGLNDDEISRLVCDASPKEQKLGAEGAVYIKAISEMLRIKGITPYLRMFSSCPHWALGGELVKLEQAGRISAAEADAVRSRLTAGAPARANIESFFAGLEAEGDILVWKSGLSRCTSASECIRSGGLLMIDVTSFSRRSLIALLTAELKDCAAGGYRFRIAADTASLAGCDELVSLLMTPSASVSFTLSTPDLSALTGSSQNPASRWLALSHKSVLFSHGQHAAELLSSELGEYDRIDVTETMNGSGAFGSMGLHCGGNSGLTETVKRDRIILPEDIRGLGRGEFIMLNNRNASVSRGTLK